jgi:hypothetical protein
MPGSFGGKLSHAVAFGFPIPLASVVKQINTMRNGLAHNGSASIHEKDMTRLGRLVNELSSMDPDFKPLEKHWIELSYKKPGEKVTFGTGDLRTDFFLAVSAFSTVAIKHLVGGRPR